MKGLLNITRTTASQARRENIYYIVTCIFGVLVYLSQYLVQFVFQGEEAAVMETGIASLTASGYLLALLLAWLLVRKEMKRMSVLTVLSKPVSRFSFISGKYLGLLYAIFLSSLFLFCLFCLNLWQFDRVRMMNTTQEQLYSTYMTQYQTSKEQPGLSSGGDERIKGKLPSDTDVVLTGGYVGLKLFFMKWVVPGFIATVPAFLSVAIVLSVTTVCFIFFEVLATTGFMILYLILGSLSGGLYEVLVHAEGAGFVQKGIGWMISLLVPDLYRLNIASAVGGRLDMSAADLIAYFYPFLQYAVIAHGLYIAFILCVGTAMFQRREIT